MMNIPLTNPLMTIGFPFGSSLGFDVAWGLMAVGLVCAIVILAVGGAAHLQNPRRRVIRWWTRTPRITGPSMAARGARQ